jgi:hypothetical protein
MAPTSLNFYYTLIQTFMKNNYISFFLIFGSFLFNYACSPQTPDHPVRLTALNSMQRVSSSQPVNGKSSVVIKAAKNEYESFQVVIYAGPENHLKDVRVEITDLTGEKGTIGKENIAVFREAYVYLPNSSPRAELPPGLYPDPLLPFINPVTGDSIKAGRKLKAPVGQPLRTPRFAAYPVDIFPGQHCIIWVDVYVPTESPAGLYKGSLSVMAQDGISASISIDLSVWDFTLPDVATHRTHLGHFSLISKVWDIEPESEQYRNTEIAYCEELARHRVNPPIPHSLLPEVNEDGSITIDPDRHQKLTEYLERTHLVDFEVPRTPFMTNTSNSDRPTPENQTDPAAIEKSKRYYSDMYQYIKENGWENALIFTCRMSQTR